MGKKLSIRWRITLWYAALIVLICLAAMASLFGVSSYARKTYCSDTLRSATIVILDEMETEHGLVEIDSDIDDVPNVYAALFDLQGNLIYGRRRVEMPFEEGSVRAAQDGSHSWMILDTYVSVPGYEPMWLRLHMSEDLSRGVAHSLSRYVLVLLPLLSVLALVGGYLLTRGALRPVKKMTQVAAAIAGGSDLSARVPVESAVRGGDELQALSGTLNAMLERLQTAFEHERQFTADAAHELRTPLSSMRIQGEYALSRESMQEKDEAIVQMLEKNESMRMMVEQLLLIARMDAGQIAMEESVDLAALLEEIAQDMEPVAGERGIAIETALDTAFVCGNRQILARAAVNLVDNAIRYSRENSCVHIALEQTEHEVCIHVRDEGEGIAPDALEHVFERFWRADCARSTRGTGIGLSIVRAAAQMHGGSVQAQSEPGTGSCFTIRLPKKK